VLGFLLRDAALLVTFLDMLGFAFLFCGVTGFVSSWHDLISQAQFAPQPDARCLDAGSRFERMSCCERQVLGASFPKRYVGNPFTLSLSR
jgi:hypothetical protein